MGDPGQTFMNIYEGGVAHTPYCSFLVLLAKFSAIKERQAIRMFPFEESFSGKETYSSTTSSPLPFFLLCLLYATPQVILVAEKRIQQTVQQVCRYMSFIH